MGSRSILTCSSSNFALMKRNVIFQKP